MKRIKATCIPTYKKVITIPNVENYSYVPDEVISRILPRELHNRGLGYILFYDVEKPYEILSISYRYAQLPSTEFYESRIHKTLKMLRYSDNLHDAYAELLKNSASLRFVDHDGYISRMALIYLSRDWREVIENDNYPNFRHYKRKQENATETVKIISQNIEGFRIQLIEEKDQATNETERWNAEDRFDTSVLQEFQNFMAVVVPNRKKEESIALLSKYSPYLEPETIQFIKSAYRAEKYLLSTSRNTQSKFDFTCLGVVLWKAIEIELNASIIKFLRLKYRIIDFGQPFTNKIPKGGILKVNGVSLNDTYPNKKLKNLMFGELKKVIEQSHKIDLKAYLGDAQFDGEMIDFIINKKEADGLPKKIAIIHSIRNPHSHTKPMSFESYQELRTHVLEPDLAPETSLIGKIADIKSQLDRKYKDSGQKDKENS